MATPDDPTTPKHMTLTWDLFGRYLAGTWTPPWDPQVDLNSPPTPQPSEQGTTPEELATIVAEETERADFPWEREAKTLERELGQATSDQWDQDD